MPKLSEVMKPARETNTLPDMLPDRGCPDTVIHNASESQSPPIVCGRGGCLVVPPQFAVIMEGDNDLMEPCNEGKSSELWLRVVNNTAFFSALRSVFAGDYQSTSQLPSILCMPRTRYFS